MSKVYIISGRCYGVYEDKTKWNVKAFVSKTKAEEFKNILEKLEEAREKNEFNWENPLDPASHKNDYDKSGTEYLIEELELSLEVP